MGVAVIDRGRDNVFEIQRAKGLGVPSGDNTASVSPGAADMARFAQSRVLVVDDSPANLALAKEMLALWGFNDVVGVTDATEAAGVIATAPPDLVLLDLHLPGVSGLDLMRHLDPLQSTTPIPVLVLTADGTMETKRQALAAKAHDFLVKPFDPEELRLRVSNLLEMRLLQLQLRQQNEELERRVAERTRELEQAKLEIMRSASATRPKRWGSLSPYPSPRSGSCDGRRLCMTSARSRSPTRSC